MQLCKLYLIYIYMYDMHMICIIFIYLLTRSCSQDFVLGVHRCGREHRATFPTLRVDDLLRPPKYSP